VCYFCLILWTRTPSPPWHKILVTSLHIYLHENIPVPRPHKGQFIFLFVLATIHHTYQTGSVSSSVPSIGWVPNLKVRHVIPTTSHQGANLYFVVTVHLRCKTAVSVFTHSRNRRGPKFKKWVTWPWSPPSSSSLHFVGIVVVTVRLLTNFEVSIAWSTSYHPFCQTDLHGQNNGQTRMRHAQKQSPPSGCNRDGG